MNKASAAETAGNESYVKDEACESRPMRFNVKLFGLLPKYAPGYDYAKGIVIEAQEGIEYGDLIKLLNLPAGEVGLFSAGGIMKRPEDRIEDGREIKIFMLLAGG